MGGKVGGGQVSKSQEVLTLLLLTLLTQAHGSETCSQGTLRTL